MKLPKWVDLVLFAGQSNMAGRGIVCEAFPEPAPALTLGAAWEYRAVSAPGQLFALEEPFGADENRVPGEGIRDIFDDGFKPKTGSMVTAFCNAYFAGTGVPIVAVSASKGGSSIAEWQPGASSRYFEDMVSRYTDAAGYLTQEGIRIRRRFVVWCQGETDGDLGTSREEYRKLFEQMWSALRIHVSEMFLVAIGKCNIEGSYNRYDSIREEQRSIAETVDGVTLAADEFVYMQDLGMMKDAFHYYQAGYNRCGSAAGQAAADHERRRVDRMVRNTMAFKIKEGHKDDFRQALGQVWPAMSDFLACNQIHNFSIWNAEDLVFIYGETEDAPMAEETAADMLALDALHQWCVPLFSKEEPMRLMYHNFGIVREDKSLIRHRMFMTKLKPGCAEEYKRRHDGLIEQRGDKIDPGPDSNFSIWCAGGYIFGYDEIDTTMEREETPEAHEATVAWETKQLGIMDWITDDVDWMTGERHAKSVRLAWKA